MSAATTVTVLVRTIVAVVIALFVSLGIASHALAVEYGGIGGRPAFPDDNIPRSKSIFIHTLEPGASTTDGLQVINNGNQTVTLAVYAADSVPSTDGGFACRQRSEPKVGSGRWINLETSQVTLEPKQNTIVPFTIVAPLSADVGEHNACILMQGEDKKKDASAGISLSIRTGIRVAITIPGELKRQLEITDFLLEPGEDGGFVISPVVANIGNVSADATAHLTVKSIFGINQSELESTFPILRDDTARWNFKLPASFWGGPKRAELTVAYENINSERVTLTGWEVKFFAPPKGVAVVIYLFAVFVFIFSGVVLFSFRKRTRWVKETWVLYVVEEGDTLAQLATKHKVAWKLIAKVNVIKPPYNISGLEIKLPPLDDNYPSKSAVRPMTEKVTGAMPTKSLSQELTAKSLAEPEKVAKKSKPKKKPTKKSQPKKRRSQSSRSSRKQSAKKKSSGKNPSSRKRK